jgi:hypothetical protein
MSIKLQLEPPALAFQQLKPGPRPWSGCHLGLAWLGLIWPSFGQPTAWSRAMHITNAIYGSVNTISIWSWMSSSPLADGRRSCESFAHVWCSLKIINSDKQHVRFGAPVKVRLPITIKATGKQPLQSHSMYNTCSWGWQNTVPNRPVDIGRPMLYVCV